MSTAPTHAADPVTGPSDPEFSFSDVCHTDVTFMQNPPAASILRAVMLPESRGDTRWADTQLAYESLPAPVRRLADALVAVHDGNREWGAYLRRRDGHGNERDGAAVTEIPPAHLTKPEHTIRHRWAPGDVGIRDNRASAHCANNDYEQTRVLARVTLRGDRPYGPAVTPTH